jgi:murein DD-endopeptidase MepM/ murein hydrolase activator NlpD
LTQSGGGGEYSLGTATLTLQGDMQPLERDLARMRAVIAEMEKRGTKIPAPNIPPPSPEAQRGYQGLAATMEALRRGVQGDGEAFKLLSEQLRSSGQAAAAAGGSGGFGGAGEALAGMLGMAGKAVPVLGQLGLAANGVQAIFGGLKGAISGVLAPLQQLSAEAGRLNKQVAEAGIFAAQSFAILGPDGKLVEGTARQMQMVRGAILKEYQGIQQEVAKISGATASEIYEGFNIILQNISTLGEQGTTENAAKLATRIAASMNTLGVPGFQLRQEVNALMMGTIDRNAMLATKLGVSRDDVQREQQRGTYYDFLIKKLEKLYDGQKVLALSLSNVMSNFEDVNQAIASEAGQPLERDTAQMMQTILQTFENLQGSFTGFFKSIAEAVGPIIKLLGPVISAFTSIGAIASSVGRIIVDVFGLVTATLGKLLPVLTATARLLELIAKGVELVAQVVGAVINPIKALFNVDTDTATAGVNSFFDSIFGGLDKVSSAIESFNQKWSNMVLNVGLAGLRGSMKLRGASDKEIEEAENEFKERFKIQSGMTEAVELRSLKLPPNVVTYLEELNTRLGNGSTRALNISKEWADIKQKAYQNEIKALEQGLTLMNKQRELAEAMSSIAAARRALEARGYELGVQVAASPEAKASAEARLADLKLSQEKEAIAERRGILQTERELQQRQMMIQEKQIKIQQEQLKIQLAEAQADQVRVAEATKAALAARGNTKARSPEWLGFTRELNVLAAEGTRNVARIAGAREALRLAFEAEGQLGTINSLEAQRLGLQEQQLDIQGQSAQYTREQQRLLAEISQEEQKIANELTRATNQQNEKKSALKSQSEEINRQNTLLERQSQLQKAQDDLAITRAKAEVQAAERLAELAELQDRARSGGGTASVIEAQIAAAAAGVSGMQSAAEVQQRLFEAKERQMAREHELQQRQMQFQHEREASEVRIQRLQMESQKVAIALQRAQLLAEISRLTLNQRRDAIVPQLAGASSVPSLGGVAQLPGSITGRLDASGQNGADMPVGPNNEMRSYHNGIVTEINRAGNNGNYAVIEFIDDLGNKLEATYSHMAAIVKVGQQVVGGQVLGRFDGSGRTFGAHNSVDINSPGTNGALQRNAETAAARRSADILVTGKVQGQPAASAATAVPATGAPSNINPKLLRYMAAARAAGFQGEDLIRMTAVGMAESSGNPGAVNNNPATGDLSYGAWQVNMIGNMGPQRRRQFGLASNNDLLELGTNARVAKSIFDSQGITAWGAFTDGRYQQYMGQARAAAGMPAVASVGQTVAAAGGTVAASTANQAEALQQSIQDLSSQDSRLSKAIEDLTQWLQGLGNIQALQQENLTEQQLAERFELEYQRRKTMLTAEVLQTPQGRLGVATGDAVSGSISSTISGSLQALLTGGDVKAAVSSALAQAGQSLMQATLDALLNPLLAQLQGGLVKAITGIDIEARAQQMAATSLQTAAGAHQGAAGQLTSAAQALMAAAGAYGPGQVENGLGVLGTLATKLPSLISGFAGLGSFMAPAGAFNTAMSLTNLAAAPNLVAGVGTFTPPTGAFTQGLAGGGEIQYGLDYLVGERNAEIVRFNKAGGKVFSNRALTKALGVPFQRTPGGGAAVAEGGGDFMGIPFMAARPTRPASSSEAALGIPFIKSSGGDSREASPSRSKPLRVSVETQVINGIEYATVEQLRQTAAAAAQAGRDSVAYDMRNSPTFQRSVGLG